MPPLPLRLPQFLSSAGRLDFRFSTLASCDHGHEFRIFRVSSKIWTTNWSTCTSLASLLVESKVTLTYGGASRTEPASVRVHGSRSSWMTRKSSLSSPSSPSTRITAVQDQTTNIGYTSPDSARPTRSQSMGSTQLRQRASNLGPNL